MAPDAEGNQAFEMEYKKEEVGDVMQLFPQKPKKRESGAARRASKPSGKMITGVWSRTFLEAMKEKGALISRRDDYYREEDWDLDKGADCGLLQGSLPVRSRGE